jgi:hypothetical protein
MRIRRDNIERFLRFISTFHIFTIGWSFVGKICWCPWELICSVSF